MNARQTGLRIYLPAFMNTTLSEEFDASATIHARLRCLMCKPVSVWLDDAYPWGYTRGEKTSLFRRLLRDSQVGH